MHWRSSAACAVKRETIILEDDGFTDPLSNEKIMIQRSDTFVVTGDVRDDGSSYKYLINLGNHIDFSVINGNKHLGQRLNVSTFTYMPGVC